MHKELSEAAEGVLDGLLAAGYGRVVEEDGWLLWACRQRGGRYAAAAEQLALVKTTQDTVVNFLRHGRPYRVTLRQ